MQTTVLFYQTDNFFFVKICTDNPKPMYFWRFVQLIILSCTTLKTHNYLQNIIYNNGERDWTDLGWGVSFYRTLPLLKWLIGLCVLEWQHQIRRVVYYRRPIRDFVLEVNSKTLYSMYGHFILILSCLSLSKR